MKTKISIFLIIIVGVIIILVFGARQKVLGNMRDTISEAQTSSSNFSFAGNENNRIKISLRTQVISGVIDFVLSDSQGNIVETLDKAKALETFIVLPYDDTYTVTAIYKDFMGSYSIKVRINRF